MRKHGFLFCVTQCKFTLVRDYSNVFRGGHSCTPYLPGFVKKKSHFLHIELLRKIKIGENIAFLAEKE